MNLRSVDLNLLAVFDAIYTERNITRAAASLGMSQPALSNALGRLRKLLQDPLFERNSKGVSPTPRARQLSVPIRDALNLIRNTLSEQWLFDYAQAEHRFTVAMSDYSESVLLPPLMDWLSKLAPGVSLRTVPIVERTLPAALADGEVDLAVGHIPFLDEHFHAQRLLDEQFLAVVRQDHPEIRDHLSLALYTRYPHIIVTPRSSRGPLVDAALQARGLSRRIALELPNFLSIPVLLAQTDFISNLPQRVARSYAQLMNLRLLEPPVSIGQVHMQQYWHARSEHDPASRWLRRAVAEICRRI
ncbi:LysR family transcriptional regulator [Alkalilimnicola sp. S0819]|uniref:LysR family transcriptional regulator n=1 Tax=Alkalilimnicola sp. S0819 TaxID=2613922 RepID=UPI00186B841D|nr:LysR family transcriptional regulator [Alkalilimnicola sp. S0819]